MMPSAVIISAVSVMHSSFAYCFTGDKREIMIYILLLPAIFMNIKKQLNKSGYE